MDTDYVAIHLQTLDTYILVPKKWPARAGSLLLTLAEQIIAQFEYVSPIVQIYGMPTRLVCRVNDSGFHYIFNKVSKEEMIGAFVYNILVPSSEKSIKIEITSGNHLNHIPWSNDAMRVIPYTQQKSHQERQICNVCGRVIDKPTVGRPLF